MKIAYISDVHLEFGPLQFENDDAADVLVLAGDICVAANLKHNKNHAAQVIDFFEQVASKYKKVLYIMGNHEFYHSIFQETVSFLRSELSHIQNLVILDSESITIDDVIFVGGTLWTNMRNRNASTMQVIKHGMNDFTLIKSTDPCTRRVYDYEAMGVTPKEFHSTRVLGQDPALDEKLKNVKFKFKTSTSHFSPENVVDEHEKCLDFFKKTIDTAQGQKIVVISHHAPSHLSIHSSYVGHPLNDAYCSDLSEFILDRPKIVAWIHGHVHTKFDYVLGTTRVVCNPRGYVGYEISKNSRFSPAIIDV